MCRLELRTAGRDMKYFVSLNGASVVWIPLLIEYVNSCICLKSACLYQNMYKYSSLSCSHCSVTDFSPSWLKVKGGWYIFILQQNPGQRRKQKGTKKTKRLIEGFGVEIKSSKTNKQKQFSYWKTGEVLERRASCSLGFIKRNVHMLECFLSFPRVLHPQSLRTATALPTVAWPLWGGCWLLIQVIIKG